MGSLASHVSARPARSRRPRANAQTLCVQRRAWLTGVAHWAVGAAILGAGRISSAAIRRDSTPQTADTSWAARRQATAALPISKIRQPLRNRIQAVATRPTVFRRMPVNVIACDPELYVFLVRHPEVVVNMWQLMGVTQVEIRRTGAYVFSARDGAGTHSTVQLVYGTRDKHIFLAEGYYEGPLVRRRVTGRCILSLTSAFSKDQQHRPFVSSRLDVFVQLDNAGAEFIAKTLHPFFGKTADKNFRETTDFLGQVCRVAENNGAGVQRLVPRLTSVSPDVRRQFSDLATAINQRAVMRGMLQQQEGATARLSDRGEPLDLPPEAKR